MWKIDIKAPFGGYSPRWFKNTNSTYGNSNQANAMTNIDMSDPSALKQGYATTNLSGNDGVTAEMSDITESSLSIGLAIENNTALLHFIDSGDDLDELANYPHTITGSSIKGASVHMYNTGTYYVGFYFYQANTEADIGRASDLSGSGAFDDDWGSTQDTALETSTSAKYPVATISRDTINYMIFGNIQYYGTYDGTTLDVQALDFGRGKHVDDITFTNDYIYLAVNDGNIASSTTNIKGMIYVLSSPTSTDWIDSINVNGKVGSIIAKDGIVYVFHQKNGSDECTLSYINGSRLEKILTFEGDLPRYGQVTLWKDLIVFVADNKVYSFGQIAEGQNNILFSTISPKSIEDVGAIANPFGKLYVSSSDNSSSHDISYYSGNTVTAEYTSLVFNTSDGDSLSMIDSVTVYTNALVSGASCDLKIYKNQGQTLAKTITIDTAGKTRHVSRELGLNGMEDFKIVLDWSGGSASNLVDIRKISIKGHNYEY